jgi:hypothetical protein
LAKKRTLRKSLAKKRTGMPCLRNSAKAEKSFHTQAFALFGKLSGGESTLVSGNCGERSREVPSGDSLQGGLQEE